MPTSRVTQRRVRSDTDSEAFGGGYVGLLTAIIFRAIRDYQETGAQDAYDFLFDDPLLEGICSKLNANPDAIRRMVDAKSERTA